MVWYRNGSGDDPAGKSGFSSRPGSRRAIEITDGPIAGEIGIEGEIVEPRQRGTGRRPEASASLHPAADGQAPDFPAPSSEQPEQRLARAEIAARLLVAVQALPAIQREAFLLAAEGGLTVAEIGQATGCGFETAKSRLRYAYARLRSLLEDLR